MRKSPPFPRSPLGVRRWLNARQISIRTLAWAIGRHPGVVSRVIRGKMTSAPIWVQIQAFMENPNGYRMRTAARKRELARRLTWAQIVIRRTKHELNAKR